MRCTGADNGVEGHVGAFVVSSPVAANKDKEGAFEITHVAKLIDFESQKQSKSLPRISETFEIFKSKSATAGKLVLNGAGKVGKVTQR